MYEITFEGALEHRYPTQLKVEEEYLLGGSQSATVKQLVEGRPAGVLVVSVENIGDGLARATGVGGVPINILDSLPAGLKATGASANIPLNDEAGLVPCVVEGGGSGVSCTFTGKAEELPEGSEEKLGGLPPHQFIEVRIPVEVQPGSSPNGEANVVGVSGGGAPAKTVSRPVRVGDEAERFGVEDFELTPEEAGGGVDTQAGSHPFQTSFTTVLNQDVEEGEKEVGAHPYVRPVALVKDLRYKLPPGLVGNPTAIPRCTIGQFLDATRLYNECPADTAVGVATFSYYEPLAGLGYTVKVAPVFNIEPQVGEPARFGFYSTEGHFGIFIDTAVRNGSDYGVTSIVGDTTQQASLVSANVTLWGVPGSPVHNATRGWSCLAAARGAPLELLEQEYGGPCLATGVEHAPPFLDLPTSCPLNAASGLPEPMRASVQADAWENPGNFATGENVVETQGLGLPALDGCANLQFVPEIKVTPDESEASKPTGLDVDVHVPQEGQLDGEGLAQSNIKDIEVTLPAGVTLNPSAADGLAACTGNTGAQPSGGLLGTPGDQVGYTGAAELAPGSEPGVKTPQFTPYMPGSTDAKAAVLSHEAPESDATLQAGQNFCPDASKVATVKIKTPLLPHELEGAVYLASPQNFGTFPAENPFESEVAMYIVAEDPVSGSLVKLPGRVELGEPGDTNGLAPGQIRSFFEDNPQLPFEDAEVHFFGGERAPLAMPARCGTYTTEAVYTPWDGGRAVHSTSSFQITSGPNGTACPGASLPFSPSVTGGALNINAGAFSPFDATFSRQSGEQNMQSVQVKLPVGLLALLPGVELCPEPQANLGECGANSLIGETTVSVGVGGEPYTVSGGKFYLTGPYNGTGACNTIEPGCAPFGVTFTVPAKAGPYDFADTQRNHPACDCVLVRGKIEVNPLTAAITITSNPPGTPDSIPTQLEGVPLEIQHINATTTRQGFQFNPTNCAKMEVTGTIHSSEGASDTLGVPFQVTNCRSLAFEPKLAVSTSAETSRADGASLSFKFSNPSAPQGTDTNYAKFKVELPAQLPSRLSTLQKACTAAQFDANPAGCPAASVVGHMSVLTPVLPVALEGPLYFVSNGGEAFPNLIVVLQGYGVKAELVGDTFISKAGVTSSTFKAIPDFPFTTAEVTLPEGKYSALAAVGDLCAETTTKSVEKKVSVRVRGRKQTVVRKVKETVPTSLAMPTEWVAQNGAEIHSTTPITVTGCPRAHKAKAKAKAKAKRARKTKLRGAKKGRK